MDARRIGRGFGSTWQRRPRPPGRWGRKFLGAVVCLGVVALCGGWRIRDVHVTGGVFTPNAVLRDAVYDLLQGNRLGVIPRSSVLLAPLRDVRETVRSRFALVSVATRRHLNGSLDVHVTEQPAAALVMFNAEPTALLGPSGAVVGYADTQHPVPDLPIFRMTHTTATVGTAFVSPAVVRIVGDCWNTLRSSGGPYAPTGASPRSDDPLAWDVVIGGGHTITVSSDGDSAGFATKLQAVLTQLRAGSGGGQARSIDLRYGDHVYIR